MLFSCIALSLSSVFATSIESLKELSEQWELSDENTLVVFDVDDALITTEDHFMHPNGKYAFYPLILNIVRNAQPQGEQSDLEKIISLTYLLPKKILVEAETPNLIKKLQKKGVNVIALTHFPVGKMGVISDVASWRVNLLKEFDFNFSFGGIKSLILDMGPEKKTLLEEGVLFTKGHNKGKVLKALFKQCNFYPSKVIFIDDVSESIKNV